MMGGNSGGPWVDTNGELVGIGSWGMNTLLPKHTHDSDGNFDDNVFISSFADSFDIFGVSSKSLLKLIEKTAVLNYLPISSVVTAVGGNYIFNDTPYSSIPFSVTINTYELNNIPSNHPIYLENESDLIKLEGGTPVQYNGKNGKYGNVKLVVKGDFGTVSYKCINHGYMGGHNNIIYSKPYKYLGKIIESNSIYENGTNTPAILRPETISSLVHKEWHTQLSGCYLDKPVQNIPQNYIVEQIQTSNNEFKTIGILNSQYKDFDLDIFYGNYSINVKWLDGSETNINESSLPLRDRSDDEDKMFIGLGLNYKAYNSLVKTKH